MNSFDNIVYSLREKPCVIEFPPLGGTYILFIQLIIIIIIIIQIFTTALLHWQTKRRRANK